MKTKKCNKCGTEKPLSEYYYRKDNDTHRKECKSCLKESHQIKKYGVCNIKYGEMLKEQEGKCAICESKLNSSRYTKFAIDHCHKSGEIRGLLCTNCNTAIGLMKDSTHRLQKAIDYLSR